MTERRRQFARVFAAFVGLATLQAASTVWAQAAVRDRITNLTTAPTQNDQKSWLEQRFAGSIAEVTTYVGSGTFYSSGYHDPYVANAFFLRPQYNLGTKYRLALAARVYVEEEYTKPDISNGRSFNPLDSWIYLNAKNLYTMPRAKVQFFGGVRAAIPISYESRYAHLITTLGISGGATRVFEFGRPDAQGKRWNLALTAGEGFSKAFRTSATRGNFAGDTTGCRAVGPNGYTGGPGAAENDRCGGPLSTSFGFSTSGAASLSHGRYSLTVSLAVLNEFKYTISQSTYQNIVTSSNEIPTGRSDATWGIVSLGYDINDHVSLSAGLASFQPALDSRYQSLRFPFFDFAGPNANNFTQLLVGVSGTL